MENEIKENNSLEQQEDKIEKKNYKIYSSVLTLVVFAVVMVLIIRIPSKNNDVSFELGGSHPAILASSNEVVPVSGVVLPVSLGSLGAKMVETGVIDEQKFIALYSSNPELKQEAEELLTQNQTEMVKITPQNAPLLLNYFWALGLGNKNEILEKGEMMDPRYGGAGNFASTGGWTIAKGKAMDHYGAHKFITLTPEQQALVDKVSQNIYRPCCGNSTHFPDCNHGMAMLGFLELMASQGATESEMYKSALILNSYWFLDTYLTIAEYMKQKRGVDWGNVDPKEVLGADYSSGSGFQKIAAQVIQPKERQGGGSCGV